MYIPNHFKQEDKQELLRFMQQFNFGLLINVIDNLPAATHLPFVIEERNDELFLISHMAVANEQWKHLSNQKVLTVFSEPHAYISPSYYEKKESVPTWNYASVHCYGEVSLIEETEAVIQLLEKQIISFDATYFNQWKSLNDDYKLKMIKGIKAFEIKVIDIKGAYKLSQNKTAAEKENIIHDFENSSDANHVMIAQMMKSEKEKF